jgi:hypothetical protein
LGAGKTPASIAEYRSDHGLYATYLNGFSGVCHGSKDTLSGCLSNTGTAYANLVEFVYLPRGTSVGYRPYSVEKLLAREVLASLMIGGKGLFRPLA